MAQFLVLTDYQDTARRLPAGAIVDDGQVDMPTLIANGIATVAYNPATMAVIRERFLSQRASEFGKPDLMVLILLSISGAAVVNSATGATTESRLNP